MFHASPRRFCFLPAASKNVQGKIKTIIKFKVRFVASYEEESNGGFCC